MLDVLFISPDDVAAAFSSIPIVARRIVSLGEWPSEERRKTPRAKTDEERRAQAKSAYDRWRTDPENAKKLYAAKMRWYYRKQIEGLPARINVADGSKKERLERQLESTHAKLALLTKESP